jgi:hypothetical protein
MMDLTQESEMSANIDQTLGKHPKVDTVNFIIMFKKLFYLNKFYEMPPKVKSHILCASMCCVCAHVCVCVCVCRCRLGSRSPGYHPVAPRSIAAGPLCSAI